MHELKTWTMFFDAVNEGIKTFEIRENDREFKIGDLILLMEYNNETKAYTGRRCAKRITYITDFAQQPGYVVMAITDP